MPASFRFLRCVGKMAVQHGLHSLSGLVPQGTGQHHLVMKYAWIPPGAFLMGGTASDDEMPVHRVELRRGFYMSVYPTTQAQWQSVMGYNASNFRGNDRPVEKVSWDDCQTFCKKVTQMSGEAIRLPTEAEWEYACRAGCASDYYSGCDEDALKQAGWYGRNSNQQTHPVGKLAANAWGLHDMHGNVWEWCEDRFGPYGRGTTEDDKNPNMSQSRVCRGGSWYDVPEDCRAASRRWDHPGVRDDFLGFRVCFFPDARAGG
jgi:formylglycine-generating enzyme required for sulfatase activity